MANTSFSETERIVPPQDGWLLPDGRFFPCSSVEHDDCAAYIIETADVVTSREKTIFKDKPPRFLVQRMGGILVRGAVALQPRMGMGSTYSQPQLDQLNHAGIKILDAAIGETHDPKIGLEVTKDIRGKVESLKSSNEYTRILNGLKTLDPKFIYFRGYLPDPANYDPGTVLNAKDSVNDGWHLGPICITESLAHFERSPLDTSVYVGEHDSEYAQVAFDTLTQGYTEGITIHPGDRRLEYDYRLVPTSDKNLFTAVRKSTYKHDGLSAALTWDWTPTQLDVSLVSREGFIDGIESELEPVKYNERTFKATWQTYGQPDVLSRING